MSWRQRTRAVAAARKALEALEAECPEALPKPVVVGRSATTAEAGRSQGKATPPPPDGDPGVYLEAYGVAVRSQAKRLLAALPPDPHAELHRRALFFAVRT